MNSVDEKNVLAKIREEEFEDESRDPSEERHTDQERNQSDMKNSQADLGALLMQSGRQKNK